MQEKISKTNNFYLKINYNGKNKKFIVRNPKQINLQQIKNSFTPPISSCNVKINIQQQSKGIVSIFSEAQLIDYLSTLKIADNECIRMVIVQQLQKNKNKQAEQSDLEVDLVQPLKKIRSKSQQIQIQYKSQNISLINHSLEATQEFLYHSLSLKEDDIEQAEKMLLQANRKIKKYRQQSRQTDIGQLLRFLSND